MDRDYQTAGEQARWEEHIKMEREAQAKTRIVGAMSGMAQSQCAAGTQVKSFGNQERTPAPVATSIARLAELVNMLDKQSESLFDRLTPVSRPAGACTGEGSDAAQEPQCSLDDALIVMCSRVQSIIDRTNSARHRLCI